MPDDAASDLSIIESKIKGAPTAIFSRQDGRRFLLHSRYDPPDEGRFLVRDLPVRERTLYVVLGFGLGYHVQQLLHRIPRSSHVLVLEPDEMRLSSRTLLSPETPQSSWIANSRLHFAALHDPEAAPIILADTMARMRLFAMEVFRHIPSSLTSEIFYRALLTLIPRKSPPAFRANLNLIDKMLENDLINFWANLPYSWNASPIDTLDQLWANRPLIVVAAGPSLTGALDTLKAAKDRALLLATGPTAAMMSRHGIQPDLVISVDPFKFNLAHFQGWNTGLTPLIYHHRIFRGVLPAHAGPKFCFAMQDESPLPLSGAPARCKMMRGGSVAFSALQLAHHLGANPIIFIGQDFAFADGHTHAIGAPTGRKFDPDHLPEDFFPVPGVSGKPVTTNRVYHSYLVFLQDYVLNFSRAHPSIRHINCSPTGAMVRGMEYAALDQALDSCPPPVLPFARDLILRAFQSGARVSEKARRNALSMWASEVAQILAATSGMKEFARLFSRFKATTLYTQAAASYDDIEYLYLARSQNKDPASDPALLVRFVEHLNRVLETLRAAEALV